MNQKLANKFYVNRRYVRSIHLERDFLNPNALAGYVPTDRTIDALRRVENGLQHPENHRAWTITSVYGTGKSAFAQFLLSLCASKNDWMRQQAVEIARSALGKDWQNPVNSSGLVRAVATARREPIGNTVVRALWNGVEEFWQEHTSKPKIHKKLLDLSVEMDAASPVKVSDLASLTKEVAQAAQTGVFLALDELGKNLEYAVYHEGADDLYLLQQIAELPSDRYPVYLLGLLHQEFTEYGQRLATVQRNEWAKIQGRFEDIPFASSPGQMMRLMGEAIARSDDDSFECAVRNQAQEWFEVLQEIEKELTVETVARIYPLHPVAALVLPLLCYRFAQNDRSLFTFLTSSEPYSFQNYLEETSFETDRLPTLKIDRVYDYFIETAGMAMGSRPDLQKWVEIQGLVEDARHLDVDSQRVLKTIGTLNLIATTGTLKATPKLVKLALCDFPSTEECDRWQETIDSLIRKGLVTYYRAGDELRLWQGSDFHVDSEVAAQIEKERSPLAQLLANLYPLTPLVAQRHSYRTGTLRYFERCYLDSTAKLDRLTCDEMADGLIGYWLEDEPPTELPTKTVDNKPFILLCAGNLGVLRTNALEFVGLQNVKKSAPQLQTDGVARREVEYRLGHAKLLLDNSLRQAFDPSRRDCLVQGKWQQVDSIGEFKALLSQVCDRVYNKTPILRNELINRRQLTSQSAKARRELIEALLSKTNEERLGMTGYGPEVAMYRSLLESTQIHQPEGNEWGLKPPSENSGIFPLWEAVESFCLEAKEEQHSFDRLYQQLAMPPYGVKPASIPVIIAVVLLYHLDDVGVYKDGTFVPVLGPEHFELLVKDPSRFSVKYFEVIGLRSQVFQELEAILRNPQAKKPAGVRNTTLLMVAKPLFQFVKKLPTYTKQTKSLTQESKRVLQALEKAQEPDELLFSALPQACGLSPIGVEDEDDGMIARTLRTKLGQAIREIYTAYDELLNQCRQLLYEAFGIQSDDAKLRQDLQMRSQTLQDQCVQPVLKRFVLAAVDRNKSDREWLEALLMVIADKPAEKWTDEDVTEFEVKLSDVARRFKNLEALQKDVVSQDKGEGFEAKRVTITEPSGSEVNQVVWVEKERENDLNRLVDELLQKPELQNNPQLQQALVAKLTEKVLGKQVGDNTTQFPEKQDS